MTGNISRMLGKRFQNRTESFDIWCPSIRPSLFAELQSSLRNIEIKLIPQRANSSFASLCNIAFSESRTDYVLIVNDKARPQVSDIERILDKLKEGYGLVGLYRFGFFGVSRRLINAMGGFDTRFKDGGYEDNDLLLRFKELDIAAYISEEINYHSSVDSLWRQEESKLFFFEKYKIDDNQGEIFQTIDHELVPSRQVIKGMKFLPFSKSELCRIPLETVENDFADKLNTYRYYNKKNIKVFAISHADNLSRSFNGLELEAELQKYGVKYNLKSDIHQRNSGKSITPKIFRKIQKLATKIEFISGFQSRFYFWTRLIGYTKEFKQADLVHLHILHNNFFRLEALKYLTRKKPTVWTLHDLWIATGHCIQPLDCGKFSKGCGNCPALNRTLAVKRDRTDKEIQRKIKLVNEIKCNYIVSSHWMKKRIKSVLIIEERNLQILPFGVPKTSFNSDAEVRKNFREALQLNDGSFAVFINAHADEIKGINIVKDLLHFFPPHESIKFVVVDASKTFLGFPNVISIPRILDPVRMNGILNAVDTVLIPSLGESFSLLTLEAMNCSKPVICLKNSAPHELIGHESRLIFERMKSSEKITKLILELSNNSEMATLEGLNNQNRALKEYSFDRYAKGHVKIYSKVLEPPKNHEGERIAF